MKTLPATRGPARYPCASCPYRADVPSGVWSADEYEKLPPYDGETHEQPLAAFFCHQQNGRLCAGWVGCHDMQDNLGLRVAGSMGALSPADIDAALAYESPVELQPSGAAAAMHGMAEISRPGPAARRVVGKLERRRERRDAS